MDRTTTKRVESGNTVGNNIDSLCARAKMSGVSSTSDCSKNNNLLPAQTEKPLHYTYLKEFRVDQCPLFLQHKCTQHKPFTCFYWHFMNQRRRRPVRKRDGTFNYSPDVYCTKFDETTGICPDGDECQYLHRTAGDTERRYHLRYYKTGICVYDTDNRGYCVKNGPHCAFAHGIHDLRNPVYDIRELQAMDGGNGIGLAAMDGVSSGDANTPINSLIGPNSLDKERNALNDDPRWQDTTYVLANYKTELCKRPPRLCRQGYACPQFHNNKDRRRSPKSYKYRSTPCPNVKQGDEWGDPVNCEAGDSCAYCHTRTEQQFHPEIYKSTKCNDMQQTGYCPRGPFCAFAHVDKEISAARDLSMDSNSDLAVLLSNALPSSSGNGGLKNCPTTIISMASTNNGVSNCNNGTKNASGTINIARINQQMNEGQLSTTVASSLPDQFSNSFDSSRFIHQPQIFKREQTPTNLGPIARPRSYSSSHTAAPLPTSAIDNLYSSYFAKMSTQEKNSFGLNGPSGRRSNTPLLFSGNSLFDGMTGNRDSNNLSLFGAPGYPTTADTVESVVGSAMDGMDDIHLEASLEKELGPSNNINSQVNRANSVGGNGESENHIMGMSPAPAIIGSTAPVNIPGARQESGYRGNRNTQTPPAVGASSVHGVAPGFGVSPFARAAPGGHGISSSVTSATSSLFDFTSGNNVSPSSQSSVAHAAVSMLEIQRLQNELAIKSRAWEERINQVGNACEIWKREADEASKREKTAEQKRDEALIKLSCLQKEVEAVKGEPYLHCLKRLNEVKCLPATQIQKIQQQLRNDLDCVDKVLSDCFPHNSA